MFTKKQQREISRPFFFIMDKFPGQILESTKGIEMELGL